MKAADLTGRVFGRLTVLGRAPSTRRRGLWRRSCSCGKTALCEGYELRRGRSKSCGCLSREHFFRHQTMIRMRTYDPGALVTKDDVDEFLSHG